MKASVVIPAFNAEKMIGKCLGALLNQSFEKKEFEVIVVDDGSTDSTVKIARQFKAVQLIRQSNAGPAVARNNGAAQAKGEIVVFLDADCVPKKNWLGEMLKPFENPEVAGVQGKYEDPLNHWVAWFVQLEIEERYGRLEKSMQTRGLIDFIGSYSAAYQKSVFLENSGFDTGFRRASGEDPDLSYRLAEKGFKLVFAPNAAVSHYHPTSIWKYWKTKFYRAYWRVRMYKKNPSKIKGDSYTPQAFKYQMGLALASIVALLVAIPFQATGFQFETQLLLAIFAICFFLIPLLTLPQVFFIMKKNLKIGIAGFFIFWVNAYLFFSGFLCGWLRGVQK